MKDFQNKIAKYLKARGWGEGAPGAYAKAVIIEAAELLEHFQWADSSIEELKKDKEKFKKVQKEIADIMIYCFDLAVTLDFDMEKVLNSKIAEVSRKYPAKIMRKAKKEDDDSAYWKIKKEHRMKGLS
jgi:NTP pyrophosphatase (non-canonical NTP hydrolase)